MALLAMAFFLRPKPGVEAALVATKPATPTVSSGPAKSKEKGYVYTRSATGQLPIFTFSAGPLQLYQADNPSVAAAIAASNAAMAAARTISDSLTARNMAAPDVLAELGQRTGITATPDYSKPGSILEDGPSAKTPVIKTSTGLTAITIYLSPELYEEPALRDSLKRMVADGRLGTDLATIQVLPISSAPASQNTHPRRWPIIIAKNSLGQRTFYGINGLRVLSFSVSDGPVQ